MKKTNKFNALLMVVLVCGLFAMGATHDLTVGGYALSGTDGGQCYKIKAATLDLSVTTIASNDVVQVINIPANCIVLSVQHEVVTVATNAVTFDVGDGADPNGYTDGVSTTNALGLATSGLSAALGGKCYTANDTIDLTFDDAPGSVGTIDVTAIVINASP